MIVVLEDTQGRVQRMLDQTTLPLRVFDTSGGLLAWLPAHQAQVSLLTLDYHLVPEAVAGTGLDVALALAEQTPFCPVVVHSTHRNASAMVALLRDAGWTVERVPFQAKAWGEVVARLLDCR